MLWTGWCRERFMLAVKTINGVFPDSEIFSLFSNILPSPVQRHKDSTWEWTNLLLHPYFAMFIFFIAHRKRGFPSIASNHIIFLTTFPITFTTSPNQLWLLVRDCWWPESWAVTVRWSGGASTALLLSFSPSVLSFWPRINCWATQRGV